MSKVDRSKFGSKRPKLTVDDLDGDVAIVTIVEYEEVEKEDGTFFALLYFEETGDKVLFLNDTQVGRLIEAFGEETDDWKDQRIVVEKTNVMYQGETFKKVYVAPPEEWDAYMKPKKAKTTRKRTVKAAKRGRK